MCGIAGIIDRPAPCSDRTALLGRMCGTIVHRGPDDHSIYEDSGFGLGFQRLAINDLRPEANQPFFNEDRTVVCICNGEIFNHKELRKDLIARGHKFRTECDVETIVHLYEEFGLELFEHLNGQFAFALHDQAERRWVLARDPVGIVPLFYTEANGSFLFASEIKALLECPGVGRRVNLTALDQMVCFPGLVSPRTLFEGIHSVKPGHFLLLTPDSMRQQKYWDLNYPRADELKHQPLEKVTAELTERLRKSVELRLDADVPVGAYISGGLDSALLVGMARAVRPNHDLRTFGIGFEDPNIDERSYQRAVVEAVGAEHEETVFAERDVLARLDQALLCAETPLKESYNTCSLALSEMVHRAGIKVVLTGEGADEMFGGYVGYRLDAANRAAAGDGEDFLEAELNAEVQKRVWGSADFFYEQHPFALRETREALYADGVRGQLDSFDCLNESPIDLDQVDGRHPMHRRSYLDFKLRMADHLLADHGDRVMFAYSVEGRFPFLDPDVLAYTATIHPDLHLQGGVEKFVLREVARPYVPKEVLSRRKFAFVAPSSARLMASEPEWVESVLEPTRLAKSGYFDPATVQRLRDIYGRPGFQLNQTFDTDLLMLVLTFSRLKELFDIPDL